jgi:hypothetical protein
MSRRIQSPRPNNMEKRNKAMMQIHANAMENQKARTIGPSREGGCLT